MRFTVTVFIMGSVACSSPKTGSDPKSSASYDYPASPRGEDRDDFHGVTVADPYRWLEETDSAKTRSWIEAQNALTFAHLEALPTRGPLEQRLTALWNYERFELPKVEGERYFFSRNDGLQNQAVLYWADRLDGEAKTLLDPNRLSADGTVALSGYSVSGDGRLLAYGLSEAGSDWVTWRVRNVETGEDLPDTIQWSKFSGASWLADHSGFFYSAYDPPSEGAEYEEANYYQKLYLHRLGTPQSDDELIFEDREHKEWGFAAAVTDDGDYLVISVWRGTEERNLLLVKRLSDGEVLPLISEWQFDYRLVGNIGERFYVLTDDNAPRRRLIAIDLSKPETRTTVVAEQEDVLESASLLGDAFYVTYLRDARSAVERFGLDGSSLGEVDLPSLGSVVGFNGKRNATETFYQFRSFAQPDVIYRLDLENGESKVWKQAKVSFDPERYVTEQVFFESADGTRIPMFITRDKAIALDAQRPTYLYGYGGFNISLTPRFLPEWVAWLELGGILAIPNLRGGGEYGREWHEAGILEKKQNVFDDFIAAAEFLKAEGYTSTERLAIAGRSNGGLLIGAVITQRPDLVAAALPAVGVMDMLRYHRFTIGWAWMSDYGDPANPDHFRALHAYSPVHNARQGTAYPATMVTTADHDDRVVPAHSYKFAAAVQYAQGGPDPVLIRIETQAGHGAGIPTQKKIEEAADSYAFLIHHLNYDQDALRAFSALDSDASKEIGSRTGGADRSARHRSSR